MRFDESEMVTAGFLIAPAALDADNSPAAFDIGKAGACTIFIEVGVGGITFTSTNKVEFKLTHSDSETTGYEAVELAHVAGLEAVGSGGIVRELKVAHASPSVVKFGYVGGRRYLKLLADFSGTHGSATPMSALAVRGRLDRIAP